MEFHVLINSEKLNREWSFIISQNTRTREIIRQRLKAKELVVQSRHWGGGFYCTLWKLGVTTDSNTCWCNGCISLWLLIGVDLNTIFSSGGPVINRRLDIKYVPLYKSLAYIQAFINLPPDSFKAQFQCLLFSYRDCRYMISPMLKFPHNIYRSEKGT